VYLITKYIQILLAIAFGYLIVGSTAEIFYRATKARYAPTAATVRNVSVGALATSIADGATEASLGGFYRYCDL